MIAAGSRHSLFDLVEQWSGVSSLEEVFNVYAETAAEFGYDQINYVDMADYVARGSMSSKPEADEKRHIVTFDITWIDYYVDRDYGPLDPVFSWVAAARGPFTWADAERSSHLTGSQVEFLRESEDAGLNNGFSVPLRGPDGQLSALYVAASSNASPSAEAFQTCSLLGQHFHNVGVGLKDDAKRDSPGTTLTHREREVLLWCAHGKSNWAIGEILGISAHGVRFHVQNIYKKLDANSRIAAVVKAIRLGLIQP